MVLRATFQAASRVKAAAAFTAGCTPKALDVAPTFSLVVAVKFAISCVTFEWREQLDGV